MRRSSLSGLEQKPTTAMDFTDFDWKCVAGGGKEYAPLKSRGSILIVVPKKTPLVYARVATKVDLSNRKRLFLDWKLRGGEEFSFADCDECAGSQPRISMTMTSRSVVWRSSSSSAVSRLGGSISVPIRANSWSSEGWLASSSESSSILFKSCQRGCHVGVELTCGCPRESKVSSGVGTASILVIEKFSAW